MPWLDSVSQDELSWSLLILRLKLELSLAGSLPHRACVKVETGDGYPRKCQMHIGFPNPLLDLCMSRPLLAPPGTAARYHTWQVSLH